MKRFGSIYLITNKIDNKSYVGQTIGTPEGRFACHARDKRSSRYLSSAIQKHGIDNFILKELIVCFNETDLNIMETYFIDNMNTLYPNGYNLSRGGHNRGDLSDIVRYKMKVAKLGKKVCRTKQWSEKSRLDKSRKQGGRPIVAVNLIDGSVKHYDFINQAERDGFKNSEIYRVLKNQRRHTKNYKFYYATDYANQIGSVENKNSSHEQRIDLDPTKVD